MDFLFWFLLLAPYIWCAIGLVVGVFFLLGSWEDIVSNRDWFERLYLSITLPLLCAFYFPLIMLCPKIGDSFDREIERITDSERRNKKG